MTTRRLACLILQFILVLFIVGCGSISNLTGGPWLTRTSGTPFPCGGVILDAQAVTYPFVPRSQYSSTLSSILVMFGGLIDLPFSIGIDILTLPYTIPKSLESSPSEKPPEPDQKKPAGQKSDMEER